ncbi:MAG: CcmD family protein [Bacteroidetes bacterium]|nr:CcmD family protein [Bacteroidota bacterium]
MKRVLSIFLVLMTSLLAHAQPEEIEMADGMRAEGKIYVVVAILVVILLGLIGYLVLLDRKTSRLEEKYEGNRQSRP